METLKQPLTIRNPQGEVLQAYMQADLFKIKGLVKYDFGKILANNDTYKKVVIFNRPNRFLIASAPLPLCDIFTDINKVFQVEINGQFQSVQFMSDFAKENNFTLQGARYHAATNNLLIKVERFSKIDCYCLVRIASEK